MALGIALPLGLTAGFAASFIPQSAPGGTSATGKVQPSAMSVSATEDGEGETSGRDAATTTKDGLTAFVTKCGKVLDMVPSSAVSQSGALQVELEVQPVCPSGEWLDAKLARISLSNSDGELLASGNVDAAKDRIFVPGFTDPRSRVVVNFTRGTGWASPDWLNEQIAGGSVSVNCHVPKRTKGRQLAEGDGDKDVTTTLSAAPLPSGPETRDTALAALRRQVRLDNYTVSLLEGSWVPQLSSKKGGTFDALDQHRYSLADIYQQFLDLRLRYPNVRLLNSTDWDSYTLDGYWVVIAGVAYIGPDEPNQWCDERSIPTSQCFAKQLVRDGAPEGTTKHRRP